jgi:hypothetical protein
MDAHGGEHIMWHRIAVLAVAGICIVTGCSRGSNQGTTTSTTITSTTITSTTTAATTAAPPVAEGALDGLLLSVDQLNTVVGSAGLKGFGTSHEMYDNTVQPQECIAIDGPASTEVYAGSGFSAVRSQNFHDDAQAPPPNYHFVEQAVVLFPSAKQAGDFFTASAQQWPTCQTYTDDNNGQWTVGQISNGNGTLSTTATDKTGRGCGRALAASNNVIIDVKVCSTNSNRAVNIANQITAKVPT